MFEERCDEVAEEGLSMGGFATEMPVFHVPACHDGQSIDELREVKRVFAQLNLGAWTLKFDRGSWTIGTGLYFGRCRDPSASHEKAARKGEMIWPK
jgi:hypothetical protein